MGVTGNRTRRAGMGTTNRELQGGLSPQKQRLGSFGKSMQEQNTYLTTSPNDLSTRTLSLRASWSVGDGQHGAKPPTGDSLRWDAGAPPLPGKNKVLERMSQPRTPSAEHTEEMVDELQFRMSQLAVGTNKKLFLHLDTNRSGYIDREELRTFLGNMNVSLTDTQFDKFYDYVDAKGDGVIDYTEFCKSLTPQERGDADQYFFKNSQGLSELLDFEDAEDAQTKSHLDVRKRSVNPPSYHPDGNLHGASLAFNVPELYASIGKAAAELPRVKTRKNKGVKSAVRVKGHTSAKKLLSMSHASELAKIVREKSHQKGHTMLKWFRWMDAENKNNIANEETELSKDDFCAFLEEKLNMEVEHEQAEELVNELGLGGREPGSVNMQSFCEEFGPRSTANPHAPDDVSEEADPNASLNARALTRSTAISGRSLKRALSVKNMGASEPGEMEPVLMELAAQVQSGPTAVSHSEMLREFKQRDVHRRGFLPVAEFKKALGKAMAGTALKDIGMQNLSALTEHEELNYIDFVDACFRMGGLYGTSKGARITPLARYSPLDRMDPVRSQTLRSDGLGTVSRSLSGGSLHSSPGISTLVTGRRRLAGPGWCDPSVDQIYKKTDYVTGGVEDSPHFLGSSERYTSFKATEDFQMLTGTQVDDLGKSRHPMQHISEAKMRRLQEQRQKAENAVWAEDQRPIIRDAARVELARNLNKAYRGNLRLDTNTHERHFNDSNAAVRFQPTVDLHSLSRKSMLMCGGRSTGGESMTTSLDAPATAAEPLPQYDRLPFVGR